MAILSPHHCRDGPRRPASGSAWRWLAALVGRTAQAAARRRSEEPLDSTALRDLGLCRSELSSFQAEALGRAPRTRLRGAPQAPTEPEIRR